MKLYHYQETMLINVSVYANSKTEAQDKVASAIGSALSSMTPIEGIDQDIRDNSFDTIEVSVKEENDQ